MRTLPTTPSLQREEVNGAERSRLVGFSSPSRPSAAVARLCTMAHPPVISKKLPGLAVAPHAINRHMPTRRLVPQSASHLPSPSTPAAGFDGTPGCPEALVVQLLPLVHRMARAIGWLLPAHAGVELDDLVGSGALGLIHAVRRFDARKCAQVEHYASIRIRGAILDSLRGWDTASRSIRKMGKKAEQACRELEAKLGRSVQESDVAGALGISPDRWRHLTLSFQAAGIDWRLWGRSAEGGKSDPREAREVAGDGQSPFDACYRHEQSALLQRALGTLPEREREILSLYYRDELTQKDIAARFRICEARVSQLHGAALTRLRTTLLGMVTSARHLL